MLGLVLIVLFTLANIVLAKIDAVKIKKNKRIRHAINAIVYVLLILLFCKVLTVSKIIGLLLIRIPVFNTFLNVFRGHPACHISHTTTSIIDQNTNRVIEKMGYWTYHGILYVAATILIFI